MINWNVINELWVIEYSVRQDCFHIEQLGRTLKINIKTSLEFVDNDYRIIALCDTFEEANNKAKLFRQTIEAQKIKINASNSK